MARVCIVTSGHVGSAPRVVKEADALAGEGHDVHVVAADTTPGVRSLDLDVERHARWTLHRVGRGTRMRWYAGRVRESSARVAWSVGLRTRAVAEAAESRLIEALARAAQRTAPSLVIGHNIAGLAAAGRTASRCGCRLAFDAEDDHVGQYLPREPGRSARADAIQRHWLPLAAVETASSPLIADALASRYATTPKVVLNAFARVEWKSLASVSSEVVRCCWISQTIGPGRGIEEAVAVLAGIGSKWSLDLRGHVDAAFRAHLEELAIGSGGNLAFLPTIEPSRLTESTSGYRLGISCEVEVDDNKRRCLGNKIFHYLAAGTPVWLSDTPAHRELAPQLGLAGVLLSRDRAIASAQLASWLQRTRDDPDALHAALDTAASRFDWSAQASCLLAAYRPLLSGIQG